MSSAALAFRPDLGGRSSLRPASTPRVAFTMMPQSIWPDPRVRPWSKVVLGWLTDWLFKEPGRFPTYKQAASALSCSASTVRRAYAELQQAGYLVRRPTIASTRESAMAYSLGSATPRIVGPADGGEQLPLFPQESEECSPENTQVLSREHSSALQRTLKCSPENTPPDPPIKEIDSRTTTFEGPSPSSFSSSLDEDRVQALGVRIVELWGKTLDYAVGRVRGWAIEFPGGLDWVERAVEGAEDCKTRPDGDGWIAKVLVAWQKGKSPVPSPRPAPTPAPPPPAERHWGGPTVPDPPPGFHYVPSQGNPLPRRGAYRLERNRETDTPPPTEAEIADALRRMAEARTDVERWTPATALRAWARDGYVSPDVLKGVGVASSSGEQKPAAGPATNFPRRRPPMSDSRGDSSLNGCSEQVSLGEPALRSARSDRVLLACSEFQPPLPKPAAPGGS
jgi:hypothetical protein